MISRGEIIRTARGFMHVPFHHQGRVQAGLDCIGLISKTLAVCNIPHQDSTTYKRAPGRTSLVTHLPSSAFRIEPAEAKEADILAFWFAREDWAQHIGFKTDIGLLHTYADVGRVVEHPLDEYWLNHTHSAWRLNFFRSESV